MGHLIHRPVPVPDPLLVVGVVWVVRRVVVPCRDDQRRALGFIEDLEYLIGQGAYGRVAQIRGNFFLDERKVALKSSSLSWQR